MVEHVIEAKERTVTGKKVKRLRNEGLVPATVYGPKITPINLQIPYRALEVALMKAGGTNLIDLSVGDNTMQVLARDVQRDVIYGTIRHVDFVAVDITSKIQVDIPIHLVGESPVVASREGILLTGTNNITVEVLPTKMMDFIEVDLSKLTELGDSITVADLDLGEDITILNDPEEMLARTAQTSAARAELVEDMDAEHEEEVQEGAEPEVIQRGREDEEEGEEDEE